MLVLDKNGFAGLSADGDDASSAFTEAVSDEISRLTEIVEGFRSSVARIAAERPTRKDPAERIEQLKRSAGREIQRVQDRRSEMSDMTVAGVLDHNVEQAKRLIGRPTAALLRGDKP